MFNHTRILEQQQMIKLGNEIVTAILERKPDLKLGDKMVAPNMLVGPDGRAILFEDDTDEHTIIVTAIATKIDLPLREDNIDSICESIDGEYLHPYTIEIVKEPFHLSEYAIFRFGIS